jgi:hypothetical protein
VKGQPGRPRRWVYVQLGDRWYARDKRWKLYNDGGLFDMKNAPFEEIPAASDSSTESRDARKRQQKVLDDLRGQ